MLSRLSTPVKILFPFAFLTQFVEVMYAAFQRPTPNFFDPLYGLAYAWLLTWWLAVDSRRRGISWPLDTGMWVYYAWFFFLPYHLFKTRGLRGFIPILCLLAAILAGWFTAVIVIYVGWYL